MRLFAGRLSAEGGSHLAEVAVGALVMAVAVTGLMGTLTSGMGLVGQSRQRSAGASVAVERLERARDLPYGNVALTTAPPADPLPPGETALPEYNPDDSHPNHSVLPAVVGQPGVSYQVDPNTTEPLVVAADGILHVDDPVTLGGTVFSVHQYVTWVDDPSISGTEDYKRVTVVVTWKFPVRSGTQHRVVQSTFLSEAAIGVTTPAPTTSPLGSASPSPSGGPTPTPPADCAGDLTAPQSTGLSLLSGSGAAQGFTDSTSVQVQVVATDFCAPLVADLSNDGTTYTDGVATLTSGAPSTVTWTIPSGDGTKTVYARFRDGVGNASAPLSATIQLDETPPSPDPANLAKSACSMSGNDRFVTLTWDGSSDANLQGYRLYRSIDSAPFEPITTTTSLSASDTHNKNAGSVRFVVRAYDKAGNESGDSNVRSFAKRSCA